MSELKPESLIVSAGRPHGSGTTLNTPLVAASNFIHSNGGPTYTREDGTATWAALEEVLGALEGGQAVSYASGMAAAAAAFTLVPPGGLVVLPDDCYQQVVSLAEQGVAAGRWRLQRLPVDDTAGWQQAAASADFLWLESPSNPLLCIADLATICAAPRRGLLVVDNTFATPLNQQPLALGADLSMHSATKFISGHSDLLAGVLIARDADIFRRCVEARQVQGATPGALEAWLCLRGLRTLAVRLEKAQANAAVLAAFLEAHPAIARVRYPGLPSHPQHAIAKAQLRGSGAIISFELRGGAEAADAACRAVRLISHATSLGGVETSMERRAALGGQQHLPPGLIRMSVGIEDVGDLRADLEQALR